MSDTIEIDPVSACEPLPVGTRVAYHGSHPHMYAEYVIWAHADLDELQATGRKVADGYIDCVGYELWPIGMGPKFGNRNRALYFVRRGSITPLPLADFNDDPGRNDDDEPLGGNDSDAQ